VPWTPETKSLPVSVVIATLGGSELEKTVAILRRGLYVPDEILVCVPAGMTIEACVQEDSGLRILRTPCKGQVAQRAYGLAASRNLYVMQLDDDVHLTEHSLEQLFAELNALGPGNALAPLLTNCVTGQYLTRYTDDLTGLVKNLSASLLGGAAWGAARMGQIDPSGIPYAIDRDYCDGIIPIETQWLPGGCVICHQADLVTENYYPFSGKAYSEDVIHSLWWRKRGVRLWVAPNITACTDVVDTPSTIKGMYAEYRARAHVVKLAGGSLFRCRLWFVLSGVRRLIAKLTGLRK
jgi:hypothetical protein